MHHREQEFVRRIKRKIMEKPQIDEEEQGESFFYLIFSSKIDHNTFQEVRIFLGDFQNIFLTEISLIFAKQNQVFLSVEGDF